MVHLGAEHSKVLRFVAHFQDKDVEMVFNPKGPGLGTDEPGAEDRWGSWRWRSRGWGRRPSGWWTPPCWRRGPRRPAPPG